MTHLHLLYLYVVSLILLIQKTFSIPSQTHIALTGIEGQIMITYSTPKSTVDSIAQYGISSQLLDQKVTGTQTVFNDLIYQAYIHNILLTNLLQDTIYYYRIGSDDDGWSDIYNLTTIYSNITYAVYGDFGLVNDQSMAQLTAERQDNVYQQVIHVGDFAYDLNDQNGRVGDQYMDQMVPVAAYVPYMVTAGNHEHQNNFSHYKYRFLGVTDGLARNSYSTTNLWYSWNAEWVHFVVIDTEMYAYNYDDGQVATHLNWLENDLIEANKNREKYPWLIMLGHKASWMDNVDWTNFTKLSHKYGVDLFLCGHEHNYERMFPFYPNMTDLNDGDKYDSNIYTNPRYMLQIVSGAPGQRENIDKDNGGAPDQWIAFSLFEYGYGHMKIYNATHLYWDWQQTADAVENIRNDDANIKDTLWLIQNNHGMRT